MRTGTCFLVSSLPARVINLPSCSGIALQTGWHRETVAGSAALACCASCWQGRDGPTKAEAFFPQKWRFLKGTFSSWCRKLCSQKHTNPSQPCLSHLPSLTQETPSALKLLSRGCINLLSNCDKGLCFTASCVFLDRWGQQEPQR